MKKLFLATLLVTAFASNTDAQVTGRYSQVALTAPDELRDSENDVQITKDKQSSKKIWIDHLIPNKRIYAISYLASDEKLIYTIPKQLVGNYQINTGCVIYDNEENQLTISANNPVDCIGISQKDYENISVGKDGVSVGKTKVGSNGKISTNGVEIKGSEVKVDAKKLLSAIQYVGRKA